jgi:hypothetical protein
MGRHDGKRPITQESFDSLILEDRTDRLCRNVCKKRPLYSALYREECRFRLLHGGSLKSHKCWFFVDTVMNASAK